MRTGSDKLLDNRKLNKCTLNELLSEQKFLRSQLRPHINKKDRENIVYGLTNLKLEIKRFPYL